MAVNRVFSGVQPTGDLHLGNYFGAVRNWVRLQDSYECIYCVVDYHAITNGIDAEALSSRTLRLAGDLIACGIDPHRSILFAQSHVPEHTELAWVLSAFAAYGDLTRMTQFKDKSERSGYINVGLFTYPVLQAADILLYRADAVPVGEDQAQHLELTRGIAHRFNQTVGQEYFPEVQTLLADGKRIMSLAEPTAKMSKSLGENHYIGLMEPAKQVAKKIRAAVTDAGGAAADVLSPGVANLIELLRLGGNVGQADDFRNRALAGTLQYGELKVAAAAHIVDLLTPIRKRREALAEGDIRDALREGARRASDIASRTMEDVRALVGAGLARLR